MSKPQTQSTTLTDVVDRLVAIVHRLGDEAHSRDDAPLAALTCELLLALSELQCLREQIAGVLGLSEGGQDA